MVGMKRIAHTGNLLFRTALVTISCICLWLCAVSCSWTDSREPPSALPTLDQVRSGTGSPGLRGSTPGDQIAATLYTAQLDVPLNESTAPAWALTDEHGLDPAMIDAWRANGLRIGLLKATHYEQFVQALPPGHPPRNRQTTLTENPVACTTAPKHKDSPNIRITMPPAQRPSTLRVGPGRFQFLAQLEQGPNGGAKLRLIPHHHHPQPTIQPRLPQDKVQDGLVFHRLALSASIDSESWLVIGLDTPDTPGSPDSRQKPPLDESDMDTPTTDPTAGEEPATTPPTTQPSAPKAINYALPNHLGRALLTASRFNKPIQIVLVVAVMGASGDPSSHQDP